MSPATVNFLSYKDSVPKVLDATRAATVLAGQRAVMIKPNLVNASPHPVTTPADCCEAIIRYVRESGDADIIVAEGCGDATLDTGEIFSRLGYTRMAKRMGVRLVDLNNEPLTRLENPACRIFPEIFLPECAFTHFIISVPVLKAHSLAEITGTLKNMIGLAPPAYYSGQYGNWKKAAFHGSMHEAILDLNRYRTPDLSLMDASVGLAEYHLGGARCNPPVGKLLAGFDSQLLDRQAASLLGMDWRSIPHLRVSLKTE